MKNKRNMKKIALLLAVTLILGVFTAVPAEKSVYAAAANVEFMQSGGDLETAFATWKAVTNATEYRAYVAPNGSDNFTRLDDELIRNYGDYYRVDAVGLKGGNYVLKVEAYNGTELISTATTGALKVTAHDRSGYAFVNGTSSGAYNDDGTLKSNAVVIYLTEASKDKVKMDVVTSAKGATTACTGITEILTAVKKGYEKRPIAIRVIGKVTNSGAITSAKDFKGDIVIDTKLTGAGITVEGIGNDAVAYGWGVRIKNASNIEVRNLGFMACNSDEGDNVGLQQDNNHIWIHNNDMFYGMAGGDADQAKGDGALDTKKSTYVTHSYNHFWDCGKCNLLGLSEGTTEGLFITYHHNWYDHSDSRHPRVRYYSAHVYNNYYDGNAKYGVGATLGSSVFVENNYFRNCQYPILTSMQGSDVFAGGTKRDVANNATFSKENGGSIKATGNIMVGRYTFIPYGASTYVLKGNEVAYDLGGTDATKDFDAIVLDRNEKVDSSITAYAGGGTYNNFDTSGSFYSYKADDASDVPAVVTKWAGRAYGGDFSWTWNNASDDFDYGVNTKLKAAVVGYTSKLVSVGGGSTQAVNTPGPNSTEAPVATPTTAPNQGNQAPAGSTVHNFTESGKTSSVFTINGNLSSSKGTVNYNGLTLTQCLKMESSTSITFSTTAKATLTLVFNDGFSGGTYIDSKKLASTNGILTVDLEAGSHEIKKGDTTNLYYILLISESAPASTPVPTQAPSATATPTPTQKPAATSTPAPTQAPNATATPTPTQKPAATSTPAPTQAPNATATPTPTAVPAATSTPIPTQAPEATAAPEPTDVPDATATPAPTDAPIGNPAEPTKSPINVPGLIKATPTPEPTDAPEPTAPAESAATPTPVEEPSVTPTQPVDTVSPAADSSNAVIIVVVIIVVVAVLTAGGAAAYVVLKKKKNNTPQA